MTQSTAQAVADARKAADYMNATAPGSPAAQQATRTYLETKRLAAMANATHDPNIARQAVQASQASVSHANNVATGRSPNAYSPYNSNGNPYSYHNSSYQTGKTPSPGAPRIAELNEQQAYYCSIADRVPNINALGAGDYGGISQSLDMTPSFLSGLLTGIGKNFSTIAVYIGASFEELTTGESRSASRAISNIKANTEQRRSDSKYPEIFDFGVILGDLLPSVALDKGAGKAASATMTATVTLKNGTSLIFAADSASVLEAAIKIAAASGALATSSNLGNDLSDLFSQIKGTEQNESAGTIDLKTENECSIKQSEGSNINPLEKIEYTDKVKAQMELGDYHSFPREVEAFGDMGKTSTITGGDGITRTLVEIEGSYMGNEGVFQFIIEPDGITCNHRLFVPKF